MRNIAVGSFASDGNAETVVCGFVPEVVLLVAPTGTESIGVYFCSVTQSKDADDLSKTKLAGAAVTGVSMAAEVAEKNAGVAGYVGASGEGFTVAATADCPENANGVTVRYIALRGDILNVPLLA